MEDNAVAVPGRCQIDSDGRVSGPIAITYNDPFPCCNGAYGSKAIRGVVMHTMVGNLPGTVACFNESSFQASAHFGIDQQGNIHQFGPIGKGWIAWAEMAGNPEWYSIEHADNANTENPLTPAQITASAQLFEVLSRFAGFPLQVTDSTDGTGYGTHVMGGQAWGGHSCPGPGPRAGQRAAIVALARDIRSGGGTVAYTADGKKTLEQIAAASNAIPSEVLRMTAVADGKYPADVAAWLNAVFAGKTPATAPVPSGCQFRVPA